MANSVNATGMEKFRVGLFTLLGILLIGIATVYVNDHPYWWRPCQFVQINVEDASGLKPKSPVKSLGIEIGYLKSVSLSETRVNLGICVTAQVDVLPETKAYIRSEGFLGDKSVELRPVRYLGSDAPPGGGMPGTIESKEREGSDTRKTNAQSTAPIRLIPVGANSDSANPREGRSEHSSIRQFIQFLFISSAFAADPKPPASAGSPRKSDREIPVGESREDMQKVVTKVNELVGEVSQLATNLKDAINPEDLKKTMQQLNKTLENASKTLSPEGGLNQTAQRSLAKLEDAIEQLRDLATRVNKGEGSLGMLLNDPSYAEEIREVIRNANRLLSRVGGLRLVVNVGGQYLTGYNGARGWGKLEIWPRQDRYYLVGVTVDPRGKRTFSTVTTTSGGVSTTTQTQLTEVTGYQMNLMLGKIFFERFDASLGILNGDGTLSLHSWLGPSSAPSRIKLGVDVYARPGDFGVDARVTATVFPFNNIYINGGIEGVRTQNGAIPFFVGAGLSFDDEDIKLLFAFR